MWFYRGRFPDSVTVVGSMGGMLIMGGSPGTRALDGDSSRRRLYLAAVKLGGEGKWRGGGFTASLARPRLGRSRARDLPCARYAGSMQAAAGQRIYEYR